MQKSHFRSQFIIVMFLKNFFKKEYNFRGTFFDNFNFWTTHDVQLLTTFTQLTEELKNSLRVWLLVLGIKEGLVECATECVKSEVILVHLYPHCNLNFTLILFIQSKTSDWASQYENVNVSSSIWCNLLL